MCGFMAWTNSIGENIYPLEMYVQEFRGSISAPEKTKGNRQRGNMRYLRVREDDSHFQEMWIEVKRVVKAKIAVLAKMFGVKIEVDLPKGEAWQIVIASGVGSSEVEVAGASW